MNKTWRVIYLRIASVGLIGLLLAACNPFLQATGTQIPVSLTAEIPATGNQPSQPAVTVTDQEYDGTAVVVADVVSVGDGWMVIHNEENGILGPPIGFTQVKNGANKDVKVQIDPAQATPVLYAMLHVDAGAVGKYEFPGADVPVMFDGQMVSPPFNATKSHAAGSVVTPAIVVENQVVKEGKVIINEVDTNEPGWIAIHIQGPDGQLGKDIGYSAVKPGKNSNIVVTVDPSFVTPVMYAMLHTDAGEVGIYEFPGPDEPQTINEVMIAPAFSTDGQALANPAGTETPAAVGAVTTPVTPTSTQSATQPPSASYQTTPTAAGMVMATPETGATPTVVVGNQALENGKVKIDQVVSGGPGWVVIYTTSSANLPDQPIGRAAVQEGDNKNVLVEVDPALAKGTLFAQLHLDAGETGTFEFPGPDAPLMIGVQMIAGFFDISSEQANNPTQAPAQGGGVPALKVADQPIEDSAVIIPEVISDGNAWLVIHRQNADGTMGSMVGYAYVNNGTSTNVKVTVDTTRTSTTMYAMLHEDLGDVGKLEFPGADVPVMVNGQMVAPPFSITYDRFSDVIINVSKETTNSDHLVDGNGMSVYLFLKDTPGTSNCTDDCLTVWPPLVATGRIIAGSGIASTKLGVLILADGTRQVTYAGAPLYTYVNDTKPGDVNGQGIEGAWFLVAP